MISDEEIIEEAIYKKRFKAHAQEFFVDLTLDYNKVGLTNTTTTINNFLITTLNFQSLRMIPLMPYSSDSMP